LLFALDVELALFGAIVIPLVIGVSLLFRRYAREAYRKVRGRLARQNAFTAEIVGGVRSTRAFGREDYVHQHFDELNHATQSGWRETIFYFALFFAIVELALRWSQAGLLFFGGRGILAGTVTAGLFVQFWIYFTKLGEPIRELGEKYNVLQSAFSSCERIFGILEQPETPPEPAHPRVTSSGPPEIRFEHVSFSYVEGTPVLRDVELVIPAGTTCALIGPTGAGKSTILSLVSRLHDPSSGHVTINGVDLRELAIDTLRRRVAVVPQDVFLFTGTLLENIRLDDESIGEDQVRTALSAVGADEFVAALEGGIHAVVEERGATFSQGERQLLAMARALCHDPDVLILDEATANIDSDSEAKILRALDRLFADRTVLVVAHRLSTVQGADQVIVIEDGSARAAR
ncbi:MAG: ABC transporter ATP-binding protein, partial [Planctomycetes bacterium]|nr:ABC transporter ATP-binding protein [Planctomycetota bacterium]